MTLERDTRTSIFGVHWWKLDLGTDREQRHRHRQLILEPYAPLSASGVVQLNAWVEEEKACYTYTVDRPDAKPKGPPTFQTVWERIETSMRRDCPGVPGLGQTIIKALSRYELCGESAQEGVHGLFWATFVDNCDGLDYLCRWATADISSFYARTSMNAAFSKLARATRTTSERFIDDVAQLLYDIGSEHETPLCLRAWQRAMVDDVFYDALHALATAGSGPAERAQSALAFLRTHESKRSHAT
jgi:hypothetical protein